MKRIGFLSVCLFLIVMIFALPVFAGVNPVPEVSPLNITADCDSVSVEFGESGNGGYWNVMIYQAGGTPLFYDENGEGSSGLVEGPLDPALEDGDQLVIEVRLYRGGAKIQAGKPSVFAFFGGFASAYSMRQLTVSCPVATATYTPAPSTTPAPSPTSLPAVDTVMAIRRCNDGRLNIFMCEPLAIYAIDYDGEDGMVTYFIHRGADIGRFAFEITPEEFHALPENVEETCVIAASANGLATAYLLPSGVIQVNAGPDEEGKFFVYRFTEFPSIPAVSTYMGGGPLPTAPPCVA